MNFYTRRNLKLIRGYCIGWTVGFIFLSIVRGVGTTELGSLQFGFWQSILIAFTLGPIIGAVSGISEIWMEERFYRKIPVTQFLLLRLSYMVVFIVVLIVAAYAVYQFYFGTDLDIISFASDQGSYAIYFYVISVDFMINVVVQVDLMLGQGNLGKLLAGKFYHPREEERIFMFLDLQSSTTLAEKLGHIKYSLLIQDCFNDLGVVEEEGAEIYQYVGDEAVLTWDISKRSSNDRIIEAFYRFRKEIASREAHYQEQYGVLPFFKAGAHVGTVTVTEIGKFKREIAYHGDPINTAARIQGMCNELNAELLISEALVERVHKSRFNTTSTGSIQLKGKEQQVQLFSVIENQ
ncbi:MAG: adenylate/guanylate cyclase domain-containing protein [Bacteroidota bacterium]